MLAKTITYRDYNGNDRTETFYFNLSQAEVVEMELTEKGGLSEKLKRIIEEQDGAEIIKFFKSLILKAYGEKSPDGKRFIKNNEIRDGFEQTEAFSKLFVELVSDANAAAAFVNGVIPAVQELSEAAGGASPIPLAKA